MRERLPVRQDQGPAGLQPSRTATSIEIAAIKLPTESAKKGSLLVNPGGPGGSGYDFVKDAAATNISDKVRANYDIVGFDPARRQALRPGHLPHRPGARRVPRQDLRPGHRRRPGRRPWQTTRSSLPSASRRPGRVLGHVDTVSAAKDLDILRAAVNDTKLNYLGYSYGTFLGSTYASLFPDNVGRMVLDGAMDPSISYEDLTSGQAKAFEKALRAYVAACQQTSGCPLSGSIETTASSRSATSSRPWKRTRCRARDGRHGLGVDRRHAASSFRSTTTTTGRS